MNSLTCMWMIFSDAAEVCIQAEMTPAGRLSPCVCQAGCGYTKRITSEDYRNAPRITQEAEG